MSKVFDIIKKHFPQPTLDPDCDKAALEIERSYAMVDVSEIDGYKKCIDKIYSNLIAKGYAEALVNVIGNDFIERKPVQDLLDSMNKEMVQYREMVQKGNYMDQMIILGRILPAYKNIAEKLTAILNKKPIEKESEKNNVSTM